MIRPEIGGTLGYSARDRTETARTDRHYIYVRSILRDQGAFLAPAWRPDRDLSMCEVDEYLPSLFNKMACE